jgi:small-conductance mechanosensitive channel
MPRIALRSALLTLLAAALLAAVARAQESPPPVPAAAPVPTAIPLSSLVGEAESATRFAAGVAPKGAGTEKLDQIERDLDALVPTLRRRSARLPALVESPPSREALETQSRAWHLSRDRLAEWQRVPTARLVALERDLEAIDQRSAVWQRTRDAALAAQAPSEAIARIDAVRTALRQAERRAKAAQRELLELQARIAVHESDAESALEALSGAQRHLQTSLLVRDAPLVWRERSDWESALAQFPARFAENVSAARDYIAIAKPRFGLQLAIFVATLGVALRMRRRTEHLQQDPRLAASAIIFERGLSSASLLTLALTPVLHPQASLLVLGGARIGLIAPVLRLLPALVDPALRPAIWVLASLVGVDAVRGPLAAIPTLERAAFTAELAVASAAMLWLMRPARLALVPDPTQIPRALRPVQRLALGLLLGSFAASALGWANLAHLVGNGTLRSAYAAVVVYGGARVLRTSLRAAVRSNTAARFHILREHAELVIARGGRAINLLGLTVWGALSLFSFALLDDFRALLRALWKTQIGYASLSIALGDVLTFVLTIWAAALLARLARAVLESDVLTRFDAQRGVSFAVARTAQYVLLLLGFFAAAAASGIDMSKFAVLAGAFGVGIGFGLQNIVNNFVSGLILLYERPIQLGDTVEVGGVVGEVKLIGVRSCTLRTLEGAELIVPNGSLIAERVTNWTLRDRNRRVDLKVGVAYGSDPHRVIDLLVRSAREHPATLAHPAPIAVLLGFGNDALEFELRFWTRVDDVLATKSDVAVAALDALSAAGIEIPYPQRDLHVRSVSPEAAHAMRGGGEPTR